MVPKQMILQTGKGKAKSPLSSQWWQAFRSKKPRWYARQGAWQPRVLDFGEMEQLKTVMLAGLKVVVIGGGHRYYSPDDLAAFLSPSSKEDYNKRIDIGHVADFFMGGSEGAAQVFHFPAIDGWEMAKEAESLAHRTGNSIDVSEEELRRRVAVLFLDETVKSADAIVLNYDVAVPIPEDAAFENYIQYLGGLRQRAMRVMNAIGQIWKQFSQAYPKPRRIIVLRNSLFWLSLMRSHPSNDNSENFAREREITKEFQEELKNVGIELIIRMEAIRPHGSRIVEMEWRKSLNDFFNLGHKQSVKRQIGIDLAMTVIYGDIGPSEDEVDELYDRVLEWFMPTCLSQDNLYEPIRSVRRHDFLQHCVDSGIGWRSSWLDDSNHHLGLGEPSSATDTEPPPLGGQCALVLDSGRDDGVTEACCEGLIKMGAKLALTFIGNEYEDGATMASQLVARLREAGGKVAAVGGIPYRRQSCSEQPHDVRFVEELIEQALHDLGQHQIDIVVNNAGWAYSLAATQSSREKRRFMDRDSRRNFLALNYVVTYLAEKKLFAKGARVINVAGISCNPATELTGNPHWKCLAFFMQQWHNWTRNGEETNDSNGAVGFTCIIPGRVLRNGQALHTGPLYKTWEATVVDMLGQWQTPHFIKQTAKIVQLLVHPENQDFRNLRRFIVPDMDDFYSEIWPLDLGQHQSRTQRQSMERRPQALLESLLQETRFDIL